MTINKRLRFEILRRDTHTCRYCGAKAPDVALAVDHVIPEALGGTDDPTNLITACVDCNSGKASIAPDAELVAEANTAALRWSRALHQAAEQQREDREAQERAVEYFQQCWENWTYGAEKKHFPLPNNWEGSVLQWVRAGLRPDEFQYVIDSAMRGPAKLQNLFRYAGGVVRNLLAERAALARQALEELDD